MHMPSLASAASMLATAVALSGCMTSQDSQAMMAASTLASGVSNIAANMGARIPRGVGAAVGAAQVASGATFMASRPRGGAGGGASGAASYAGGGEQLPDTAACRRYLNAANSSNAYAQAAGTGASYVRLVQAYYDCMNSQPDHPAARKARCGPGKYRVITGTGVLCGMDQVRAYAARTFGG